MKQKFILRFNDLSIKKKITYLYLPLAIIPMLLFAFISANYYESAIVNRSIGSMEDNNILVSDRIDAILSEAESSATFLTLSINRLLNNEEFRGTLNNNIKLYNLISNELSYAKLIYRNIDSIGFIDKAQRLYFSDFELQNGRAHILASEMYTHLQGTTGNRVWFELNQRDFLTKSPEHKMLTLGKKVWNINTGETIGFLFININETTFTDLFSEQLVDYSIYKDDGRLLYSKVNNANSPKLDRFLMDPYPKSKLITLENNRVLVTKTHIERLNWILLSQANLNVLTRDLTNILMLLVIMLLTIIILEITMTSVLNNLITNPIMKLKQGVEEISKGNFDFHFRMKTNDEIGLFAQSFNHMSAQIKKLLKDVEREEKKKREYELALIQQQIKPHFLYNSLDIILKLSQLGQNRKAQKVTIRLADYYRKSLSCGADVISVKDEINLTVDYLELQKLRYSEMFDYQIDVSNHIEGKVIPKLSLQPIVENAIEHGFSYSCASGHLRIYDEIKDDVYAIIITDNGAGIAPERVERINAMLSNTLSTHQVQNVDSFGLKNVNHRLKLFFGDAYGIHIKSLEGKGTEIMIKLPREDRHD